MNVVLVHGMGRTPLSLRRLARHLRREGFAPWIFGYVAALERVDHIVDRLTARLAARSGAPWCGVGHSLGGVLLRAAADRLPPERRPRALVLLGTPFRSSSRARRMARVPVFRLAFGDAGRLLADPERMARIPMPPVPVTVIAGTAGRRGPGTPFGAEPNDGIVAVSEATTPGAEIVTLPVHHTSMMNDAAVRWLIVDRCRAGAGD